MEAFSWCYNLTSVIFPESLTSIGDYSFPYCSSLASITLPKSITSIGKNAFDYCSSLQEIHSQAIIPPTCGQGCFYDVDKNTCTVYVLEEALEAYKAADEWKEFKNIVEEIATGEIAENFEVDGISYHLLSAEELTVEVVAGDAQYSGEVTIPATVTYDGISYRVTTVGEGAFSGCENLSFITLPEKLISVGNNAFYECRGLSSISLPEGIITIGENAFCRCESLTSIEIPDGVKKIGQGTFSDCKSLTIVTIPNNVTLIENAAFTGCSSLVSINIPEGIEKINGSTFEGCSSLVSITIPGNVNEVDKSAFWFCSSLQEINVVEENLYYTSVDGVLFDKEKTILICCPEGKTGSYTVPEGVSKIGDGAFEICSKLLEIGISESVTSIGYYAFSGCSSLQSIDVAEGNVNYASIDGVLFDKNVTTLMVGSNNYIF